LDIADGFFFLLTLENDGNELKCLSLTLASASACLYFCSVVLFFT